MIIVWERLFHSSCSAAVSVCLLMDGLSFLNMRRHKLISQIFDCADERCKSLHKLCCFILWHSCVCRVPSGDCDMWNFAVPAWCRFLVVSLNQTIGYWLTSLKQYIGLILYPKLVHFHAHIFIWWSLKKILTFFFGFIKCILLSLYQSEIASSSNTFEYFYIRIWYVFMLRILFGDLL